MKCHGPAGEEGSAVQQACARFVRHVLPVLSIERLAVVLFVQGHATARVVFSWAAPDGLTPSVSALDAPGRSPVVGAPSFRIMLEGTLERLGAVLVRGRPSGATLPEQDRLVLESAGQLAMCLENIGLRERLERGAREGQTLERIGELARRNAPALQVYRHFAGEIKGLVECHRIGIYVADHDAGLLTCVYRAGLGVRRGQPGRTFALSLTGCAQAVSVSQGVVVGDLQDRPKPGWPELDDCPGLRSAIVVPVPYAGKVVGAVALENRLPHAYGPGDETLLRRAAALLGPPMAGQKRSPRFEGRAEQPVASEVAPLLAPRRRLDRAHALRSPLSSIKGYSSTLLQTDVAWAPEDYQEFLEAIDREADELDRAVTELLRWAGMET